MKGSAQRIFLLALAAFVLGALGTAAVLNRDGILRAYHLVRLRGEPGRLDEMLREGGPRAAAARKFVQERAGKEALFLLYMEEFDENQPGFGNRDYLRRVPEMGVTHGSFSLWMNGYSCQTSTGKGGSSFAIANIPKDPARRERILELIGACVGEVFRDPSLERFEFQIRPARDGRAEPPRWPGEGQHPAMPTPVVSRHVDMVCFFRVLGEKQGGPR